MGAFEGGLTFRKYYTNDPLPEDWKDRFQAGIAKFAFKEIDPAGEEERAIGWCSAHFPLDVDVTREHWDHGEYLVLAMRIDTLTVPGPLLKIFCESEARRVMAEQKRESLNRYEKAEIKERVKQDLRKKLMPSIKTIDMVWSWAEGVVRFYSGNEKVNLEFMEMFEQTFDRLLIPDSAYTMAMHGGPNAGKLLDEKLLEALESIEPEPFVDPDTQFAAMKEV